MKKEERPDRFDRWDSLWNAWHEWLIKNETSPLDACLGWVKSSPEVNGVVIGVDSVSHLREILVASKSDSSPPPPSFASNDLDLINPYRWASL